MSHSETENISASRKRQRVNINVGGQEFSLKWSAIRKYQHSRLERIYNALTEDEILSLCDEYNLEKNEYFFDRHPKSFENIWNLLHFGRFYFDCEPCTSTLLDDLVYWGYSVAFMPICCRHNFEKKKEVIDEENYKVRLILKRLETAESQKETVLSQYKAIVWNIMENPETSILSRVVAAVSIFFIVLSTVCLLVSTLPELHQSSQFQLHTTQSPFNISVTTPAPADKHHDKIFDIIEYVCIAWFTLEYLLRFFSANSLLRFLKGFLNIIDFIAIAPFYLSLIITTLHKNSNYEKLETLTKVLQVFRVLRILRVLKLARHSVGLQSLGYTFQKSYKELGLLISFIAIGVFLFSSILYFAEKEVNFSMFPSIPHAFWWAIISMTTVGYGDCYPITAAGQLFASFCCVTGVLVVALPIPIIVSNFSEFYKDKIRIEKTQKKRDEMEQAQQAGSYVFINTFAQQTVNFLQPFSNITCNLMPKTRTRFSEMWSLTDWKYIDTSSVNSDSTLDDISEAYANL